jgi:hypothetical protein
LNVSRSPGDLTRALLLGVVVLALAGASCAHGPNVAPGSGWVTARSPHFVVHTNLPRALLEPVLQRLEATHEALTSTLFRGVEVPEVEAVLLDDDDYETIVGRSAGAFFPGVGASGSLLVVRDSENPRWLEQVVAHELAHRFVDARHPDLPSWMDEGIAVFLETAEIRARAIVLGAAARHHRAHFAIGGTVPLAELAAASRTTFYGAAAGAYYSTAWAIVRHLLVGNGGAYHARFERLLDLLESAPDPAAVLAAFSTVYPEISREELEAAAFAGASRSAALATDTLLTFPHHPAPPPAFRTAPADRARVQALLEVVHARRRREDARSEEVARRAPRHALPRQFLRVDADPPMPSVEYLGLALGRLVAPRTAVELAAGRSPIGTELALLGRHYLELGDDRHFFAVFALGPTVGLKAPPSALPATAGAPDVARPEGLSYVLALRPEVALELRTPLGLLLRVGLGWYVPLVENMSRLCQTDAWDRCTEPRGAVIAASRLEAHIRASLGWAF